MGSDAFETDYPNGTRNHTSPFRGLVLKCVQYKCVVDVLPGLLQSLLTNGKFVSAGFLALNLGLVLLWLPLWLLSFFLMEWGVYLLGIVSVFFLGRCVIRFIAFPGASTKMTADIEREFTKYSVRMLESAILSISEVAALLARDPASPSLSHSGLQTYELPASWKRAITFRNRVLGVYLEVFQYLYQQPCESSSASGGEFTKYGNNKLLGDLGNLNRVTPQARTEGLEVIEKMKVLLALLDALEEQARPAIEAGRGSSANLTPESRQVAAHLLGTSKEMLDYLSSLKPSSENDEAESSNENQTPEALANQLERQSPLETVTSTLNSIIPMLDPPPVNSVFSFDLQRGCMLSRYRGARQFWVRRPKGGMIDVLHFPAAGRGSLGDTPRNSRAVLYCNPNAGLIEVAAGMSLVGGNVPASAGDMNAPNDSWADYYTDMGLDLYVFNYAGYGRSYGTTMCVKGPKSTDYHPGLVARLKRIVLSSFCTFQPRPDTLRDDGLAVAEYLLNDLGVEQLVIHGESIGGVAASSTARLISENPNLQSKLSLVLCDRTFCNLEAVAQRLVGGWTGNAIRILAPFWTTDVTGDFLAASCPKVVANDAADMMIADPSSLKSGMALWKELHRGVSVSTTKGIGWITEAPLQYRMTDWEDVCVSDSRYVGSGGLLLQARPPEWPRDRHVSVEEAFHFAACVKRIGKQAKIVSRQGGPVVVYNAWVALSCLDGLTGDPLGVAVKRGFDATVTWLCCLLVFGTQSLVAQAENRLQEQVPASTTPTAVTLADFDTRPKHYKQLEQDGTFHPKPLPEVLGELKGLNLSDPASNLLRHEFQFVIGMLEYSTSRLMAPQIVDAARINRNLDVVPGGGNVGCFLNLHCGHNNAFSANEQQQYRSILRESLGGNQGDNLT